MEEEGGRERWEGGREGGRKKWERRREEGSKSGKEGCSISHRRDSKRGERRVVMIQAGVYKAAATASPIPHSSHSSNIPAFAIFFGLLEKSSISFLQPVSVL